MSNYRQSDLLHVSHVQDSHAGLAEPIKKLQIVSDFSKVVIAQPVFAECLPSRCCALGKKAFTPESPNRPSAKARCFILQRNVHENPLLGVTLRARSLRPKGLCAANGRFFAPRKGLGTLRMTQQTATLRCNISVLVVKRCFFQCSHPCNPCLRPGSGQGSKFISRNRYHFLSCQ